jgi:hypothetical protein
MAHSHQIFASGTVGACDRLLQPVRVRPAGDSAMLPKFHASNSAGQHPLEPKVSRVKFASPGACREAKFHASNFQLGAGGRPAKRGGQPMPPPK